MAEKRKIKGWITRGGKHIPLFEGNGGGHRIVTKFTKRNKVDMEGAVTGKTSKELDDNLKKRGLALDSADRHSPQEKVTLYDDNDNVYEGTYNQYHDGSREVLNIKKKQTEVQKQINKDLDTKEKQIAAHKAQADALNGKSTAKTSEKKESTQSQFNWKQSDGENSWVDEKAGARIHFSEDFGGRYSLLLKQHEHDHNGILKFFPTLEEAKAFAEQKWDPVHRMRKRKERKTTNKPKTADKYKLTPETQKASASYANQVIDNIKKSNNDRGLADMGLSYLKSVAIGLGIDPSDMNKSSLIRAISAKAGLENQKVTGSHTSRRRHVY